MDKRGRGRPHNRRSGDRRYIPEITQALEATSNARFPVDNSVAAACLLRSINRLSMRLACGRGGGLVVRLARVRRAPLLAPGSEQVFCQAAGASPWIVAEQWSEPLAQESSPGHPAHSMAVTSRTNHLCSLRQVIRRATANNITYNVPKCSWKKYSIFNGLGCGSGIGWQSAGAVEDLCHILRS